jgi:hypothetical protein
MQSGNVRQRWRFLRLVISGWLAQQRFCVYLEPTHHRAHESWVDDAGKSTSFSQAFAGLEQTPAMPRMSQCLCCLTVQRFEAREQDLSADQPL